MKCKSCNKESEWTAEELCPKCLTIFYNESFNNWNYWQNGDHPEGEADE